MIDLNRRRLAVAAVLVLVLAAGAVGAQTYLFTAGSGVTINATNGPAVTLGEDLGLSGQNPTTSGDDGVLVQNTTVTGPEGAAATVTDPSSAAPTLSSIDTNGGTLEAETAGIQTVGVTGSITEVTYRDVDLQSDTTEFEVSGTGSVTIHGFTADEWVRVERVNGDDDLVQADGDGVATVNVDSGADFTIVETGGGPTLSDASPTGGEIQSATPVDLSVNVTDPDFDTTNEEVTLEWTVDGSVVNTTTVSSNGTATYTTSVTDGGEHNWSVAATDTEGNTDRSPDTGSHTFNLPSELKIYEETNPDTLIDSDAVNITVRFFTEGGDEVIERSPSNGTVSLQNLPTDTEFVVTVDADGYEYRRIIVDSLIEQQDIFLLPSDAQSADIVFELDDQTGRFPSDSTRLYVERALNQSGDTSYRVIAGDRFGSSGQFPVALQDDDRYRLRIVNDAGETRVLGAYTTSGDDRAILPIGTVNLEADVQEELLVQANIQRVTDSNVSYNHSARVLLVDNAKQTESFSFRIVNETGAVVRSQTTHNDTYGRYIETVPLPNYTEGETYYVEVDAERDGETREFREPIGDVPQIAQDWGIDPWVLSLMGYVALVGFIGLLVIVDSTLAAVGGVILAALLTLLGVVSIPSIGVGVAGAVAALYRLGGGR